MDRLLTSGQAVTLDDADGSNVITDPLMQKARHRSRFHTWGSAGPYWPLTALMMEDGP